MNDYSYPSVFLAYLLFFVMAGMAFYFFVITLRDGYWDKKSGEDIKYKIFEDEEQDYSMEKRHGH